jgi:circadian clock protein KaiC
MENDRPTLPTGVPGLDRILRGGLPSASLHLVMGGPGVGKTVLAHQIASSAARHAGAGVLYLTTLTEGHQSLLEQARSFSFFDASLVPGSWYYASLYPAFRNGGLSAVSATITRLVAERQPGVLILDGLQTLHSIASEPVEYHQLLNELQTRGAVLDLTTIAISSQFTSDNRDPGLAVPDGILNLGRVRHASRTLRLLEVEKLRGVGPIEGSHIYTINEDGVHVFPRLSGMLDDVRPPRSEPLGERLSTGIAGLDEVTAGGIESGSVTLMVGAPGTGKTLTALTYAMAGIERGEKTVFLGFHENPQRLANTAESIGLPLRKSVDDGSVSVIWRSSSEVVFDEVAERLLREVDDLKARRVVIESFDDLRRGAIPESRFHDSAVALFDLLRERQVGVLVSLGVADPLPFTSELPMGDPSAAVDNIIMFHWGGEGGTERQLEVIKMRGHGHDRSRHAVRITASGIEVESARRGAS